MYNSRRLTPLCLEPHELSGKVAVPQHQDIGYVPIIFIIFLVTIVHSLLASRTVAVVPFR